ncbi:PAS domain S-box protein, partial [bacterium]|nr:PAS domain S-box protein [bacterium]
MVLHNGDQTIRYVSPSSVQMIGYTLEEVKALPPNSLVHPDDLPGLNAAMPRLRDHAETPRLTYRVRHKDGHYLWMESEVTPIFDEDGAFDCFLAVTRDISERKATEDALRRAQANLRAMLDSTWHSFTLIDPDGRVIEADEPSKRAALALFGRRIAAGDDIYDFVLPHDHDSFTANFARALNGETLLVEKTFNTPDGVTHIIEFTYYPVYDETGAVTNVCMSHQDITERRRSEQAAREAVTNLYALLDATLDAAFLMCVDGTVLAANEVVARRPGVPSS